MVKPKIKSCVQWSWRGDTNNWVTFDTSTTDLLETEYNKGTKKIKVDKERFIDVSLPRDDIVKNFNVRTWRQFTKVKS
jgi:hypothetical protein